MEITKNDIKKALYQQKPTARGNKHESIWYYTATVTMGGNVFDVQFNVPEKEADGFDKFMPAQLLIRWMVFTTK